MSVCTLRWGDSPSQMVNSPSQMVNSPSQMVNSPSQMVNSPSQPIQIVVCNADRYHLGSVALGSFVVSLIQFVRFLLEYLEKKSKIAQAKAGVAGAFVKYLMCCVNCCMWYLEKVVKFINR